MINNPEPPDNWNRRQELDDTFNRLVLYEVLIRNPRGLHGHIFHPEFARFVDTTVRTIKGDSELKAIFHDIVKEFGDFGYTSTELLPQYLAAVKIMKALKIMKGTSMSQHDEVFFRIVRESEAGASVENWSDDQLHEM